MASPQVSYEFGAFRLDATERVLFHKGRPVPLTPKATETLLALVERHGRLVTKEELFQIVWPDAFVEENNLAQNISMLRRILGDDAGGAQFIETVPKRGYRFVGGVIEKCEPQDDAHADIAPEPAIEPTPDASRLSPPVRIEWTIPRAAIWGALLTLLVAIGMVAVSRTREPASAPAAGQAPAGAAAENAVTRIAVLPFLNLGSPADESFVAGMTEEIASRLAGFNRLAVPSSTTLREYDRRGKDVRQMGADLGVAYFVEGSIRWAEASGATRVRITPKLIRVADDTTVWTQQYEATLPDLFKVQADIAYQIAGALQVALDARERRSVTRRPTEDTDAYTAFLRGIAAHQQGMSDTANLALARAELEQAVARDPRFALAWGWLARAYASQYRTGAQRTPEVRQAAYRAARTAIDLDPGLPEAHLGLAQALFTDRDYEGARRELDIARIGLPNSPEIWQLVAFIEQRQARWSESLHAYMRAFDVDPASTADVIAVHYLHLRQYDQARRFISIARAANRSGAMVPDAWTRFSESGDVAAARPVLESALDDRSPADGRARGLLARLEWFDGRHQRALDLIGAMDAAGGWMAPNFRFPASLLAGHVYESLGRRKAAAKSYAAAMADLEQRQRSSPDDYQTEAALALAAAGLGRSDEAIRHAVRAVEILPVSRDAAEGPLYLYLLAQVQTRVGRHADAFATLDTMFSAPCFYNEHWVQRDPGFAALRTHPSFRASIERWSLQRGDRLLRRNTESRPE